MDRRNQNIFFMAILILLLIALAVFFAVVDTGGLAGSVGSDSETDDDSGGLSAAGSSEADSSAVRGESPRFPWPLFIPIGSGILIPFMAQKLGNLRARGVPRGRLTVLLAVITAAFLASVAYIVLRTYRGL